MICFNDRFIRLAFNKYYDNFPKIKIQIANSGTPKSIFQFSLNPSLKHRYYNVSEKIRNRMNSYL
ncbi:hypothetical protein OC25_18185 [Pedobacter kyungheensis]|uniref:Uncharacterized protein n=1 Tax=Pedobacter kyungheensis TaxID=1069985 RepID=A0A0C1DDL2_9SPHI|nr:hypothetical protein OC25_18185 [Pedobacter kyungheensis]